jgi:hypothetical protein
LRNGLTAERKVARLLERFGYLVASRRHFGGAGDLLAWRPVSLFAADNGETSRPLLIEVKATVCVPWHSASHFGPAQRADLFGAAEDYDVEPLLAWVPPYLGGVVWCPVEDWPS